MQLRNLTLHHFRCFKKADFSFDKKIILFLGDNGVGKTSLLEAIHYLCYLRSFRTYIPKELIKLHEDGFFIRASLLDDDQGEHELQVGVTTKKKVVKLNNKQIFGFKELVGRFRVISLSDQDLQIVQGAPEYRRSFIDQYIFLHEIDFSTIMRNYRTIVEQRNALLQQVSLDKESYKVWTERLWKKTTFIQRIRKKYLEHLIKLLQDEQTAIGDQDIQIKVCYRSKRAMGSDFDAFLQMYPLLQQSEQRLRRSLFGAHLDDFIIQWHDKHSRLYASRGQQKLVVFLLKIAQMKGLRKRLGESILLLDDFMTDFDERRVKQLLPILLSLKCPIFFTCAQNESILRAELSRHNVQEIILNQPETPKSSHPSK